MSRLVVSSLVCAVAFLGYLAPAAVADTFSLPQSFGAFGAGDGQFDHPLGVGVGDNGNVWVVDALNDRVTEWSGAGAWLRAFGSTGSGRGQFRLPEDVEEKGGFLYISDCYGQRVQRIDPANFVPAGEFTGGATRLKCPEGLAVVSGQDVLVADTFNDRVVAYDPTSGAVLSTFSSLPQPRDVAVSPVSGDVYVTVDADTSARPVGWCGCRLRARCSGSSVRAVPASCSARWAWRPTRPGTSSCPTPAGGSTSTRPRVSWR